MEINTLKGAPSDQVPSANPTKKQVDETLQANNYITEEGEHLDTYHKEEKIRERLRKNFKDKSYEYLIKNAKITQDEDNYIFVQNTRFNHIFKQNQNGTLEEIEFFKKYNNKDYRISGMEQRGKHFLVSIIETDEDGESKKDYSNKALTTRYLIDKNGNMPFQQTAKEIPGNFYYNETFKLHQHIQTIKEPYKEERKKTQTFYNEEMNPIAKVEFETKNSDKNQNYEPEYYQNNNLIISRYEHNDQDQKYYQIFQNGNKIREGNLEAVKDDPIFQAWKQEQKRQEQENKREEAPSVEEQLKTNTGCTIEYSDDQKTAKIKNQKGDILYTINNINRNMEESANKQIKFYREGENPITIGLATDSPILQIETREKVERNGEEIRKNILINTNTGEQKEYQEFGVRRIGKFFQCFTNNSHADILNEELQKIGENANFERDKPIIYRGGKQYLVAPRTGIELTEFIGDPKQTYEDKEHNVIYYIVDIPHGQGKTKEVQVKVELAY